MIQFEWILPGPENPADILSNHWGYQQGSDQLHGLLFIMPDNNAPDDEVNEQQPQQVTQAHPPDTPHLGNVPTHHFTAHPQSPR
jgi:hypothetical protein